MPLHIILTLCMVYRVNVCVVIVYLYEGRCYCDTVDTVHHRSV